MSLSKKTIVLFLIDGLQVGGAERSLLLLCKHIKEFTPIVLVLSDSLALKPEFEKSGIQVLVKLIPRNYRFRQHATNLKPLVDSINPHIIQSSLFHADMILRYLNTKAKKVSSLVSTMYSDGRMSQLNWQTRQKVKILKFWDSCTAYKVDLFIANSRSIKNHYQFELGYDSNKVKVIYRGRSLARFVLDVPRKKNQLLFVGRLIPSKGLKEAIGAFAVLSRKYQDLVLVIAGDGPEKGFLVQFAKSLGVSERVQFLGQVNRIPELLNESSFFLFPSHYEGLPGSLIEAMLAKIPIICSDISENKECVDESMALFHRVGDSEDLLGQMKKAINLTNWEVRTQLAYDYAVQHFDIETIAQQYEEVYQKLLNL